MSIFISLFLPSILGIFIYDILNKAFKWEVKKYIYIYSILCLLSNTTSIIISKLAFNLTNNLETYLTTYPIFLVKYIITSIIINILLALIFTIIYKYISISVEYEIK